MAEATGAMEEGPALEGVVSPSEPVGDTIRGPDGDLQAQLGSQIVRAELGRHIAVTQICGGSVHITRKFQMMLAAIPVESGHLEEIPYEFTITYGRRVCWARAARAVGNT